MERAIESGRSVPNKLPSVALKSTLESAEGRLRAIDRLHNRAAEHLAEVLRTEAPAWAAAELDVADQAEAECMAALTEFVAVLDRAREARAVADWVASARTGSPPPFTGAERPGGDELLRLRVENSLGIPGRQLAAQQRRQKREQREREAAYGAKIERRKQRQAEQEAGEERSQAKYIEALENGGVPVPSRPASTYVKASPEIEAALGDLLEGSRSTATIEEFISNGQGSDHA